MSEAKRERPALGEVNVSTDWQIRLDWASRKPVIWPPTTWDHRASRQEAERVARLALSRREDPDLHVTKASVRAPGARAWLPVALPECPDSAPG